MAETRRPPQCVELSVASESLKKMVTVMGVVKDPKPLKSTRGTDLQSTFELMDTSGTDLTVRFFRPTPTYHPLPRSGDVMLLRGVQITDFTGQIVALGKTASWVKFPADCLKSETPLLGSKAICSPHSAPFTQAEESYARQLFKVCGGALWEEIAAAGQDAESNAPSTSTTLAIGNTSTPVFPHDRFCLIKDIQLNIFADLVCQVVKIWDDNGIVMLYVTDYTANEHLFDYSKTPGDTGDAGRDGDAYGYAGGSKNSLPKDWKGPLGKRTLTVNLFAPHAQYALEHVKLLSFVSLQNVQIKANRKIAAQLEGAVRTDSRYPEKVLIELIRGSDSERVRQLKERKMEYLRDKPGHVLAGESGTLGGPKRKAESQANPSKNAEKKQKQREKREKELQRRQQEEETKNRESTSSSAPAVKRYLINTNIKASHPAIPTTEIYKILHNPGLKYRDPTTSEERLLPFQNVKYRTTARVIDFWPPNIEDFAVPYSTNAAAHGGVDDITNASQGSMRWEWRFILLIEDGNRTSHASSGEKECLKVYVDRGEGEFLLKLDAVDLRKNPQTLSALQERLFHLWGDLHELKTSTSSSPSITPQKPSSRPFECCLNEFGVLKQSNDGKGIRRDDPRNWERRFSMFGTTISA